LEFFNSFKMKISVVFGISQMFMGTILRGMNAIYFHEKLDVLFEFIPMVLFSSSLFIYMVFLIFYKWTVDWNSRMLSATCVDPKSDAWGSKDYNDGDWASCKDNGNGCTPWGYTCTGSDDTAQLCPLNYGGDGDGCQPPNLITTLIDIFLNFGTVDEPMYKNQDTIQTFLAIIALLSVPVLLCGKPFMIRKQMQDREQARAREVAHATSFSNEEVEETHHHEESHSFGDIFIHQAIETIEFVLGMISNTASYLRLWALSLAHSELATVFWEKTILECLTMNWIMTYLSFAVFASITTGVLLMMDVLECFLHALRLHWVEFQNKFFKADGIRFVPFSFKTIIQESIS